MEELTEVVTSALFHPQHCNIFAYSTSKGAVKLCDMRQAALCDQYSKGLLWLFWNFALNNNIVNYFTVYEEVEDNSSSFFSELISLVSDLKFTQNGRYMVTRDYLTVKVWDLNMEKKPVETYNVHEYLRSKLCSLYENEYIFDKFECSIGGNDKFVYLPMTSQFCTNFLYVVCLALSWLDRITYSRSLTVKTNVSRCLKWTKTFLDNDISGLERYLIEDYSNQLHIFFAHCSNANYFSYFRLPNCRII